jgi:RNA polymerase-interacting CarD/CdnL/TRCF family regulator
MSLEEIEEVVARLSRDRDARALNSDIRSVYNAALDRLRVLLSYLYEAQK